MKGIKVITVTDNNIRDVYGRIKKLFNNRNRTGYIEWHNFNCGFKKRINPYIEIDGGKVRTDNKYTSSVEVEMDREHRTSRGKDAYAAYIRVKLGPGCADIIQIGDRVAFRGNHLIVREPWDFIMEAGYIYTVYQAIPMSLEEQEELDNEMQFQQETEERLYEDDYRD